MSSLIEKRRALIRSLIESAGGQFASVTFTKKDGTVRVMNVQPAAGKFHVVGEAASDSAKQAVETRKQAHPELLAIWDVAKQAFRSINLDTVTRVAVAGTVFEIEAKS
ncbi:hypothetical protein [Microcystis phage Mwe-JY26]